MTTTAAVIPARMGSSRFPGKPLATIAGKPMLQHVYERTAAADAIDQTFIATPDHDIAAAAKAFGAPVITTSHDHQRASDRVAEAAASIDADIITMVQGDEPMTDPNAVDAATRALIDDPAIHCLNLAATITSEDDFRSPNTIKVLTDAASNALAFSRAPIPYPHDVPFAKLTARKQVCVIPFRRHALLLYAALEPTPAEAAESIDMLRFLEHAIPVRILHTDADTHAVDTPQDLARVEALIRAA